MADIYIGQDKQIQITVNDSAGSALDLSTYEGYRVTLYYESDRTVIQTYSKNTATGYNTDDIDTTSEASGIILIDLQRALTEAARGGARVRAEVAIQVTDADYASSQRREYATNVYVFDFKRAAIESTVDIS